MTKRRQSGGISGGGFFFFICVLGVLFLYLLFPYLLEMIRTNPLPSFLFSSQLLDGWVRVLAMVGSAQADGVGMIFDIGCYGFTDGIIW